MNDITAALARKALWRVVLTVTGGIRAKGVQRLPDGPCVIVANHNSHADTAALLAALPARRRPAVAAAADYWFAGGGDSQGSGRLRPWACQALCGAFPVRRGGGGTADLEAAGRLLAAGRDVIIYPEGSRSRDGSIGEFRHGAARLAALRDVPIVPAGITGTRSLLPASGTGARRQRGTVTVRFGMPVRAAVVAGYTASALDVVPGMTTEAHEQVTTLATGSPHPAKPGPDSMIRVRVAALAASWYGVLLVAAWAFGEALSWPLLPELILAMLCVAAPKAGPRLALGAAVGSIAGGAIGYLLAAHGIIAPEPVTTARMHAAVASQVAAHGPAAVLAQPLSGIPFKVYVAASGAHHVGFARFVLDSAQARGARIGGFGLIIAGAAACARRWRRLYPGYLLAVAAVYLGGWAAIVSTWS